MAPGAAVPYSRLAITSGVRKLPATGNKDVSNSLVEDQLYRNAGIRTRKYSREWLLLVDRVLFQNGNVVVVGGEMIRRGAQIARHQFLQCGVGSGWVLG